MKLLVVVVTYNAMKWLDRCFKSVLSSSIVPDIFVIDNGSVDGTPTYLMKEYPTILFHQTKVNLGFGLANNIGLRYAQDHGYNYVYLLNQDAWVLPDTFEKLINVFKSYTEYGVLSPFQMEANMKHLDKSFKKNSCSWDSSPELLDILYLKKTNDVITVNTVMAAHWMLNEEIISKVGGFSPTFKQYAEDDNYLDRVLYHGFKIGIVPSAQAVHDRENRDMPRNKKIYMAYTQKLRRLSNPLKNEGFFKVVVWGTLKDIYKFKSLKPISYLFKIIYALPKINNNLKYSKLQTSSFLDESLMDL